MTDDLRGALFFYALGGFTKTRNAQRSDGFDERSSNFFADM